MRKFGFHTVLLGVNFRGTGGSSCPIFRLQYLYITFQQMECMELKFDGNNLPFSFKKLFFNTSVKTEAACSPFLSFLYQNNTRKKHAGREIRTRRIGTRRDGVASRPSLFSFNHHFLRTPLLGVKYSTDLKRKGGLQAVLLKPPMFSCVFNTFGTLLQTFLASFFSTVEPITTHNSRIMSKRRRHSHR